jgi:hypothetical protein
MVRSVDEEDDMKTLFLPTTTLGKWSIGLAIGAAILFVVFLIWAATGHVGGDTWTWDWLSISMLFAAGMIFSAMVTGIVGIVKSRERSLLVMLAVVVGGFFTVLLLGEFLVPH